MRSDQRLEGSDRILKGILIPGAVGLLADMVELEVIHLWTFVYINNGWAELRLASWVVCLVCITIDDGQSDLGMGVRGRIFLDQPQHFAIVSATHNPQHLLNGNKRPFHCWLGLRGLRAVVFSNSFQTR